jgi:hypothetical protein
VSRLGHRADCCFDLRHIGAIRFDVLELLERVDHKRGEGNVTLSGLGFCRADLGIARAMEFLKRLLIVAILVISTSPLYAQRQQQNVAKLKDDARNAVGIIGGDKAKTQTYCQIIDLGRQMNQAVRERDRKKAEAIIRRARSLSLEASGPHRMTATAQGLFRGGARPPTCSARMRRGGLRWMSPR